MTKETEQAFQNFVNCFKDACDLRTLCCYSKNLSYKQILVNNMIADLLLETSSGVVLDVDYYCSKYPKNVRMVVYDRVCERVSSIQRYLSVFEHEPYWIDILSDVCERSGKTLLILSQIGHLLELSL